MRAVLFTLLLLCGGLPLQAAEQVVELLQRLATMEHLFQRPDQSRDLLRIGASVLALAFLTKGAMWPLGFWLPTTYAAASPPVAAMR